jgi:hypothetical protein
MCRNMHMPENFSSHSEILELWRRLAPGKGTRFLAPLARDFAPVRKTTVVKWYYRNSIPPRYWPQLIDLVDRRFDLVITPRQLMMIAANQSGTQQPAEAA